MSPARISPSVAKFASCLLSSTLDIPMAEAALTTRPQGVDTRFFGHPRGLATLFFTEMWERYSFYGTRALLMLYMTHPVASGALGFSDMKAGAIYGFYTA